jgi:lipoate-protein ligase A
MYHLELTLETPAENLALDEALLDEAAEGELKRDVLRLWEPREPFVVLGRSSHADEVNVRACAAEDIPVLRRCSGGATVVAGPGCLMYAVVLDSQRHPEITGVERAHRFVLGRNAEAFSRLATTIGCQGTSDLVLFPSDKSDGPPRKFSGNSLRLKRDYLLYHGTILYAFPLDALERWLGKPTRTPDYRAGRSHGTFVANFPASAESLGAALKAAWQADEPLNEWPKDQTEILAAARYSTITW